MIDWKTKRKWYSQYDSVVNFFIILNNIKYQAKLIKVNYIIFNIVRIHVHFIVQWRNVLEKTIRKSYENFRHITKLDEKILR